MHTYQMLLEKVRTLGERRANRTGIDTLQLFGEVINFAWADGFPIVTTKKLAFKTSAAETECLIHGRRTLADFHALKCRIWDANQEAWNPEQLDPDGHPIKFQDDDLGRIYGVQWRGFRGMGLRKVDQLERLVHGLLSDPMGRRHLVTAWHPVELDEACLPACHTHFQVNLSPVKEGWDMDLIVYMRSVDLFLGLPFDINLYALLQAALCNELFKQNGGEIYQPRNLKFMLADTHIYVNHLEQVETILDREPLPRPGLDIQCGLFDFKAEDCNLDGYQSHAAISAEMAV